MVYNLFLKVDSKVAGFIRVGPWGKQSGDPMNSWSFELAPGLRMQKIIIDYGDDVIHSLMFIAECQGVLHTSQKLGGLAGGKTVSEVSI
ncbi:putative jacalin-like lectin domain superfamily [Helianthus anomalus]